MAFFENNVNPYKQALLVMIMSFAINVLVFITRSFSQSFFALETHWTIAIALSLFFIVFNCLFFLFTNEANKYWFQSIISYLMLAIFSCLLAYVFSGVGMDEAGSYRWIYVVFTMGFVIFLSIIRSMRWIVEYAQKDKK